jgi:hypothetical protein
MGGFASEVLRIHRPGVKVTPAPAAPVRASQADPVVINRIFRTWKFPKSAVTQTWGIITNR